MAGARPVADHHRIWQQGFRDHVRWDVAADTLVLTGSREAFELPAEQVRQLAEDSPAYRAVTPDAHCCAEISIGRTHRHHDRRRPYSGLHAEICR
ncbi:hypothetical protein [Catellatospora sp. TT07R-123]|uniref:hypothetical protein n=1 Tax=Catellatospora sp. TT07R-123 TaxID=2733863 RepID=UPI001BB3B922|nr:hypothetical protein [Catellatospora sp. TT07R-123]